MSEALPGIELFLSSDKAVDGANKFKAAVESAAQAVERIGAVVDKLDSALDRLGKRAGDAAAPVRKVGQEAGKADDGFRKGADGADKLDGKLGRLGATSLGVSRSLSLLLGAAGAVSGLGAGVAVFSDYEDKLRILGTLAGASEVGLRRLEAAALDLSKATRFSPREAIQGLTELNRAGLSLEDSIQAIKPTADLARAGLIGLGDASGIVTKTMAQFALSSSQAARIADVFTAAANNSNADVQQLADSLAKTGPVARQFNVPLEDTVAALSKLADNGIAANIAGTGLQRILIQLRTPTEEAQRALLGLGLAQEKINPEKVGLVGALKNLAGVGLTVQDAVSLVGTEFASVLTVLTGSSAEIDKLGASLRSAGGEAAKQAAAGANTLAAAFADLRNASEQFATASARGGIGGALTAITRTGAEAVRVLSGDAKAMQEAGAASRILATSLQLAAIGGGALTAIKLAQFLNSARFAMLGLNVAVAANPLTALAGVAGAVVSAFIAFGGSSDTATQKTQEQKDKVEELNKEYQKLLETLGRLKPTEFGDRNSQVAAFQTAREELQKLGKELEGLKDQKIPLEKILGVSGLSDPGSPVAKLRQLVEDLPRLQNVAAGVAADYLKTQQNQSPLGANFGVGRARFAEEARREAEAAKLQAAALQVVADAFRAEGVEADSAGQLLIKKERAVEILRQALAKLDEQAGEAGVSLAKVGVGQDGMSSAVKSLIAERKKELELAQLTGVEREKALLIAEAEKRAGQGLTEVEKANLAVQAQEIVRIQQIVDLQRKAKAEAEKAAQLQRDLPKNLADLQEKYSGQLAIAQSEGEAREVIRAQIQATNDAKEIGLALDSEAFSQLQAMAIETAKLTAAERQSRREDRTERRSNEAETRLAAEEELLKRVGIERDNYRLKIEAETDARQAGLKVGSAEFADYVKRRVELGKLVRLQDQLGQLGSEFGQAWGSALEDFVFRIKSAKDAAEQLLQSLARIAFQKAVTNQLVYILEIGGRALANYFGGGAPAGGGRAPAGTTTGTNPFTGQTSSYAPRLSGGVIPAMGGTIVDQFQTFQRGGNRYSVAEGGAVTPEAVLPLQPDARGRLGVVVSGGAGGDTINMSFPAVRTAQDARATRATLGQRMRQLRAADRRGRRGLRPADA